MNNVTQVRTARVFVLEPVKQRIDDAKRFGEIEYIFPHDAMRSSIFDTDSLADEILESLERMDYRPDVDYLVMTGNQIPLVTAVAAIVADYGEFKALLFHAADHCYVERILG